jgi:hypothetical protein
MFLLVRRKYERVSAVLNESQAYISHGDSAQCGRARTELTRVAVAPTVEFVLLGEPARVTEASPNRNDAAKESGTAGPHNRHRLESLHCGSVTKLTKSVATPASSRLVLKDSAVVCGSAGNRNCIVNSSHPHWSRAVDKAQDPQLTLRVVSPTLYRSVLKQSATVTRAKSYRNCGGYVRDNEGCDATQSAGIPKLTF